MVATYDQGTHPTQDVQDQELGGVVMREVPSSERRLAFRQTAGEALASSFTEVVQRFVTLAAGGALASEGALCEGLPAEQAVAELPSFSPLSTRAWVLRPIPSDHVTELEVCSAERCASGDDANVRDILRFRPRHTVEWGVLLEAGFTYLPWRASGGPDEPVYTRPAYQEVGGLGGPEQRYDLVQQDASGRLFSLAALLGLSLPIAGPRYRFLVAAGLVLFDVEGRRSFSEAVLRIGVPLPVENVYLTLGAGLAFVPMEVLQGQPRSLAVMRPDGPGTVPPRPPLTLGDATLVNLTVGLAIDLALFGQAADSIIKALSGGSSGGGS